MRGAHSSALACTASLLMVVACTDSTTPVEKALPNAQRAAATVRTSALNAGPTVVPVLPPNPYAGDLASVAEGEKLYLAMNCHGCHGAKGGGGIGPPLADADWIYGADDANIYQSVVQGRPNGMPTFGGKLPDESVWKIAAYVRTLGESTAAKAAQPERAR